MNRLNRMFVMLMAGAALLAASCNQDRIYNQFVTMPGQGWSMDSLAVFRVTIDKADVPYHLFVQVRNESTYSHSNLWLFVDVVSPDGKLQRDTLECQLADADGRWRGSGWGSLYSLRCPYRLNTRFAAPGTYTFRVQHGMRREDLEGIRNIGMEVLRAR